MRIAKRNFAFIFFLFAYISGFSQLSGSYTVGKSTADFPNLDSAFEYIDTFGISGPVELNLLADIDSGEFIVNQIKGSSSVNTLTIQSDKSRAEQAIISNFRPINTSATHTMFKLYGASNLHFKNVEFLLRGYFVNGREFMKGGFCNLHDTIENLKFLGCYINAQNIIPQRTGPNLITEQFGARAGKVKDIEIDSCRFGGGLQALYLSSWYSKNVRVTNSEFLDFGQCGICVYYVDTAIVTDNIVRDTFSYFSSTHTGSIGIQLGGDTAHPNRLTEVRRNEVYSTSTNSICGISVGLHKRSKNSEQRIYNNSIYQSIERLGNARYYNGLFLRNGTSAKVYHNSILVRTGRSRFTSAFRMETRADSNNVLNNRVFNNIFLCTDTNRSGALYFPGQDEINFGIGAMDYNIIKGDHADVQIGAFGKDSLKGWQTTYGLDSNSTKIAPRFLFDPSLRSRDSLLDGKATVLKDLSTDIDGQVRDTVSPDVGCDEFDVPHTDLALLTLDLPVGFCATQYKYKVLAKNEGLDTLEKVNLVLQMSRDGSEFYSLDTFFKTDTVLPGDSITYTLDKINTQYGSRHLVRVIANLPNGKPDEFPFDNVINSQPYHLGLIGTYNTSDSASDARDLKESIAYLNNYGVCGKVKLILPDSIYTDQLQIEAIPNSSTINTLTFEPSRERWGNTTFLYHYKYPSMTQGILLHETGNIRFRGFRFKTTNPDYGTSVGLGDVYDVHFDSCSFTGSKQSTFKEEYGTIRIIGRSPVNGLEFNDCVFKTGTRFIDLDAMANRVISGLRIKNCHFEDYSQRAIFCRGARGVWVNNCTFLDTNGNSNLDVAVWVEHFRDSVVVSNNDIVHKNHVTTRGIYLSRGTATNGVLVANNKVHVSKGISEGGISVDSMNRVQVIHNSVRVTRGYPLLVGLGSLFRIENNILFADTLSALYVRDPKAISRSDRNFYFCRATDQFFVENKWISPWKWTNDTKLDSNSIVADPCFENATTLLPRNALYNGQAKYYSQFRYDRQGQLRDSSFTDPGSDNFDALPYDLHLDSVILADVPFCGKDTLLLKAIVVNTGDSAQSNIKLTATFNGDINDTLEMTYTDTLLPRQRDTFHFQAMDFSRGGNIELSAFLDTTRNAISKNDRLTVQLSDVPKWIAAPKTNDTSICMNKELNLFVMIPKTNTQWFVNDTSSKPFHVGATLSLKRPQNDTNFFYNVLNLRHESIGVKKPPIAYADKTNKAGKGISIITNRKVRLDSLTVFPDGVGSLQIVVWDFYSQKVVAQSKQIGMFGTGGKVGKVIYTGLEIDSGWHIVGMVTTGTLNLYSDNPNYSYSRIYSNDSSLIIRATQQDFKTVSRGWVWFFDWKINPVECPSYREEYKIKVNPLPIFELNDTVYCGADPFKHKLQGPSGKNLRYKWSRGDSTQQIASSSPGKFSLDVWNEFQCTWHDSARISQVAYPVFDVGSDTFYCSNTSVLLRPDRTNPEFKYMWNDGTKDSFLSANIVGMKVLTVSTPEGCTTLDSAYVDVRQAPVLALNIDTNVCKKSPFDIKVDAGDYKHYFLNGQPSPRILRLRKVGKHNLQVTDSNNCTSNEELLVSYFPSKEPDLGTDSLMCKETVPFNLKLTTAEVYSSYFWQDSTVRSTFTADAFGTYKVVVVDGFGCEFTDSIKLEILNPDTKLDLGEDQLFCAGEPILGEVIVPKGFTRKNWSTGEVSDTVQIDKIEQVWLAATDKYSCVLRDTVEVRYFSTKALEITPRDLLNPELPVNVELKTDQEYNQYSWSDGSSGKTLQVSDTGLYWLHTIDSNDCSDADTLHLQFWETGSNTYIGTSPALRVYPNPVRDVLILEIEQGEIAEVHVFDQSGKLVRTFTQTNRLDVATLASGTYRLLIKDQAGHRYYRNLIKN